jgi:hypothetical protein
VCHAFYHLSLAQPATSSRLVGMFNLGQLWYRARANLCDWVSSPRTPPPAEKTAVLLCLGQSNSANAGEKRDWYLPHTNVSQLDPDGHLSYAAEPLRSAAGSGASVWPRVADRLIAQGYYTHVIIASVGVGGTSVEQWTPLSPLWARVTMAVASLTRMGLAPTHVCWHQGESDSGRMNSATYAMHLDRVVRGMHAIGVQAPFLVATASYTYGRVSEDIRGGQHYVIHSGNAVAGPDTDFLGRAYRYDDLHFNTLGLNAHADGWLAAIVKAR